MNARQHKNHDRHTLRGEVRRGNQIKSNSMNKIFCLFFILFFLNGGERNGRDVNLIVVAAASLHLDLSLVLKLSIRLH